MGQNLEKWTKKQTPNKRIRRDFSLEWNKVLEEPMKNPQLNDFRNLLSSIKSVLSDIGSNSKGMVFIDSMILVSHALQLIPILMFDEANTLKSFLLDHANDEGKIAFADFLEWMVAITQSKICHVVLGSSDGFFLEWVNMRKY
jgi:hypothetical protein